jgi:alpha-glucosidase
MKLSVKRTLLYFFLLSSLMNFAQKVSTISSNVTLLKKEFSIDGLNTKPHKVWLYLPPNYTQTKKKYPVIYMHDGQNLFDDATAFLKEWQIDESLNTLYSETGEAYIVVGIENGGDKRIEEYTPWENERYGGGKGAMYIEFIKNELKPYIDANYRTKPKAKHTAIIGSSLGGLISFYGGFRYPDTFGKIGALSTSFWFSNEVEDFAKQHASLKKSKLYLLVGGKEGGSMVEDTETIKKILLASGFPKRHLKTKIVPEGKHNEDFWNQEFLKVIHFLYH